MKPLSHHCYDYLKYLNQHEKPKGLNKEKEDAFMAGAHSVLATIQWAQEQNSDELIMEVFRCMVEELNDYMQEHYPEHMTKYEPH
jgi:hypothetical protein